MYRMHWVKVCYRQTKFEEIKRMIFSIVWLGNICDILVEITSIQVDTGVFGSREKARLDHIAVTVIQLLGWVWLFVTPWTAALQASLSFTISWSLLKCMSTDLMIPSNHLILCHPPSHPALNLSQHQGSFPVIGCLYQMAKVLELQLQHVLPMNIQDWFPLGLTGLICLQSKGLSRVFSNTVVWKYQFFGSQPSLWSNSHICVWLLEKP